ncbi:6-bladed beta-propeller [Bacteroides sp. 519]|uniref:6-bladed beta-propeller n=1 Tax=Bacteroides sp. 519 TaxID=2302937 RepID=UPI0013D83EFF|nr:6-bladed beta-propeller [Bacteroides sp. 519]NDV58498.1 6-bladed beta-propeller [Bacteroides sp. 519]
MKKIKLLSLIAIALVVFPINGTSQVDPFKKAKKVATKEKVGNSSVIVGNPKLFTDTLEIPLSYLTEKIEVLRLDDREEALIGRGRISISDNYILISNQKQTPFKLFDKKGKFITNIGVYGQGPNEYLNTYDEQLDEKNNRIYILPWQSNKLLVFDLEGNALPPIPLALRVPKGKFVVDTPNSLVTVTTLPFEGMPAVVWTQDLQGNRKNFVPAGHLTVPRDFSNEVDAGRNTSAYDVMLMVIVPPRQDSLYHYNHAANKLEPRFTLNYGNTEISWHSYYELPNHFWGNFQVPVKQSANITVGSKPAFFIVDKETLLGNYFYVYNDLVGKSDRLGWPYFNNGYYIENLEPAQLIEKIEKELADSKLPKNKRSELQKLLESLDPEGNNVLIYAKLKK